MIRNSRIAKTSRKRGAALKERQMRLFAQDQLLALIAEHLEAALLERGANKAMVARAMRTSRSHVTQIFSGTRNMTLRTLSDVCFALGVRMRIRLMKIEGESS